MIKHDLFCSCAFVKNTTGVGDVTMLGMYYVSKGPRDPLPPSSLQIGIPLTLSLTTDHNHLTGIVIQIVITILVHRQHNDHHHSQPE